LCSFIYIIFFAFCKLSQTAATAKYHVKSVTIGYLNFVTRIVQLDFYKFTGIQNVTNLLIY